MSRLRSVRVFDPLKQPTTVDELLNWRSENHAKPLLMDADERNTSLTNDVAFDLAEDRIWVDQVIAQLAAAGLSSLDQRIVRRVCNCKPGESQAVLADDLSISLSTFKSHHKRLFAADGPVVKLVG